MEIGHTLCIFQLALSGKFLAIPLFKCGRRIFWKRTTMVDGKSSVEQQLHRLQSQSSIHQRGHLGGYLTGKIGVGKHTVAHRRFLVVILQTRRLDDVANANTRRTCHLTPLAVEAILQ